MAVVYDIFGRKPSYDTEEERYQENAELDKHIDQKTHEISSVMKMYSREDPSFDPLSSIILVPRDNRSDYSILALHNETTQNELIHALKIALNKAQEMKAFEGEF